MVDAVEKWGDRVWLFTSRSNPIAETSGLQWNEVAFSGLDFMVDGKAAELARTMGVDGNGQMRVVMTGSPVFEDTSGNTRPKLFMAFCSEASNPGLKEAVKVTLVTQ